MQVFLRALLIAGFLLTVSGCNTTRGLGEDVQAVGETIENVAEDTREELKD